MNDSLQQTVVQFLQEIQASSSVQGVVAGNSMSPALRSGEILKLEPVRPDSLEAGDVVVYRSGAHNVVHRIVAKEKALGKTFYRTKGDANAHEDRPIAEALLIARVVPEPHRHPDLSPVQRLVILLSDVQHVPEEDLNAYLDHLAPSDWPLVIEWMMRHDLGERLWYQLERVAHRLPPDIAEGAKRLYFEACGREILNTTVLEELQSALDDASVPFAFVKGAPLQEFLYPDQPFPRGSLDIDILLFGREKDILRQVADLLAKKDFHLSRGFHQEPGGAPRHRRSHDASYVKTISGGMTVTVEPHRAPSNFHTDTKAGHALMKWLENQRTKLPGKNLTGLSAEGALIYLTINFLKDGRPNIRLLSDLKKLLSSHADSIDWDAVYGVARRGQMSAALNLTLAIVKDWGGVAASRRSGGFLDRLAEKMLKPHLTIPRLFSSPATEMKLDGLAWNWCVLAFGWTAFRRAWFRYEHDRMLARVKTPIKKIVYVLRRPFELAFRLGRLLLTRT